MWSNRAAINAVPPRASAATSPPRPGCTNDTCGASPYNPFLDALVTQGYAEDTFYPKTGAALPDFSFSCMDNEYLTGLAAGATGMLGLTKNQISLHKQASTKLKLADTFSLCLPASGAGKLAIGIKPKSVKSTQLIVNPVSTYPIHTEGDASDEYFIEVKAIAVARAVHNSIYKPLTRAFAKAASDMRIKSAAAVAPFRACFRSDSIARMAAGPAVPEIELVLGGKDTTTWRMRGANVRVEIDRETTCLGFVDGGSSPRTAVVIGAHQLEKNLLEFDLVSSRLRFSENLLLMNTTCSKI
ncbi:hypothetical protein SASPL_112320 [Salvia splendens]|uniref:Peptidase A1 domain-containing protein n=1 Tax=Salvia splendens TaxID=180675 RepID=A0A8X8YE41_SALSN|nr:hypothetical protein SASPL_112320 [Salvia splendens]